MLRLDWRCAHCLKELPANVRADAYFCQASAPEPPKPRTRGKKKDPDSPCRKKWYARRVHIRESSIAMAHLETTLCQCAKVAYWYRLALYMNEVVWIYPAIDRPTMRFDGVMRQTPGFRLHPFEPPVIPKRGQYNVYYYDWEGNPVDTPRDPRTAQEVTPGSEILDFSQLQAEPVVIVSIESGQRWDLRDFASRQHPPQRIMRKGHSVYKSPLPPLEAQVLDQRPPHAKSYRLMATSGSPIIPTTEEPPLPLHPFVSPAEIPEGRYYIEYYEVEQVVILDGPQGSPIAMVNREKPLGPTLPSRDATDSPTPPVRPQPTKDDRPELLSERDQQEIVRLLTDPRLGSAVLWELQHFLAPAAADSIGQDSALQQVSEAERRQIRGIVYDPPKVRFLVSLLTKLRPLS